MEGSPPGSEYAMTTLTIEARDLDTDARRCTSLQAQAPADPTRQRAALIEAVAPLFPEAKLRSFSNGAATFLDSQHLIVASYAELPVGVRRRNQEPDGLQDSLFAA